MISAGEFRNGVTFDMDGKVMQVVEFQHVKPGKGAAFVRVKMKNVITGAVTETSFNPTAKFPTAFVERKKMEYSYNDGSLYYFMDQETLVAAAARPGGYHSGKAGSLPDPDPGRAHRGQRQRPNRRGGPRQRAGGKLSLRKQAALRGDSGESAAVSAGGHRHILLQGRVPPVPRKAERQGENLLLPHLEQRNALCVCSPLCDGTAGNAGSGRHGTGGGPAYRGA